MSVAAIVVAGDGASWTALLEAIRPCSDCNAPHTHERDGALYCSRHSGAGTALPHAPAVHAIVEKLGEWGVPTPGQEGS